ncbi:MAG: BNR-4 repeat-containing protein, partial [Balneolales bacterium]
MKYIPFLLVMAVPVLLSSCRYNPELENQPASPRSAESEKADGYQGIWFTLGQFTGYGDKYSGGLGTYTANHIPLAIYSEEAGKTFFVYGGTTGRDDRHLLIMASYYDHARHRVPRPTIVYDKQGVDDPHDNPSIAMDGEGYIWVFISGRGQNRPGSKYRSAEPYSVEDFELVTEQEMTYPQPWWIEGEGFIHMFTKYTDGRELYFETSPDGYDWSVDRKLAGIRGHYQVSGVHNGKIGSFFNRHPEGSVDRRTDLYYMQTTDFGRTWTTADGQALDVPLVTEDNPARVFNYSARDRLQYTVDLNWDRHGNPILLYVTSNGHTPGPDNEPRFWEIAHWTGREWRNQVVARSDHNYDLGSLYVFDDRWVIIGPLGVGPQPWGTGGEMEKWVSRDEGRTWKKERQITVNSARNHKFARRPVHARDPFFVFWA